MNSGFIKANIATDLVLMQSEKCKYLKFSVAENVSYPVNKVNFYNVTAFNHKAEFICRNFKKGQPILIIGHLDTSEYTDKNNVPRKSTSIIVDEVDYAGFCKNDPRAYSSVNNSNAYSGSASAPSVSEGTEAHTEYNCIPQSVHICSDSNNALDSSEVYTTNSGSIPETPLNYGNAESADVSVPDYNGTDGTIEHDSYSAAQEANSKSHSAVEDSDNTDIEALINAALGK